MNFHRATVQLEGTIPPLVKGGGSGRVNGNKKLASRVRVNDYEEKFVETSSGQLLEGYFGKLQPIRTIRSQSTRSITLEESSPSTGSGAWKRNFTFDLTQTIEFVGEGCDSTRDQRLVVTSENKST